MELLNIIQQLEERIAEKERDIEVYQEMIDHKKQEELALREKVETLSKKIDKDYAQAIQ